MKSDIRQNFLRYFPSLAAGLALLAAALYFAPAVSAIPEYTASHSGVSFLHQSELPQDNRDLISIYDHAPIFLVTRRNYAGFVSENPRLSIPSGTSAESPQSLADDFRKVHSTPVADFDIAKGLMDSYAFSNFMHNRAVSKMEAAAESQALVNVVASATGKKVFTRKFSPASVPQGRMWNPVEMSVLVAPDMSWSSPVLMTSSGVDALDSELEAFVKKIMPEMKLQRGYYIITLSP